MGHRFIGCKFGKHKHYMYVQVSITGWYCLGVCILGFDIDECKVHGVDARFEEVGWLVYCNIMSLI